MDAYPLCNSCHLAMPAEKEGCCAGARLAQGSFHLENILLKAARGYHTGMTRAYRRVETQGTMSQVEHCLFFKLRPLTNDEWKSMY